jgi:BirA family biotin operon repressor/biotin-[acetyl-CoA-carboxylase] ligase
VDERVLGILRESKGSYTKEIKANLKTKFMGRKIYHFEKLKSTMEVAHKLALSNTEEGSLVLAESQTEGKGRLGREWLSPSREGIWLSLVLYPGVSPFHTPKMSLTAALGVARTIRKLSDLPAFIKWPNDVLVRGKKVCGVLVEMNTESEKINYLILGVGVNLNVDLQNFPPRIRSRATSLKKELGHEVSRVEFLQVMLKEFEDLYLKFRRGEFNSLLEEVKDLSTVLGKRVRVISNRRGDIHGARGENKKIEGEACDLDLEGNLIVRLESGFLQPIAWGNIEVI